MIYYKQFLKRVSWMRPSLYLLKREIGGKIENPKTEVHFVVVDSDTSKDYPLNFICVLPKIHGLDNRHSIFGKIFGEGSVPLAKSLLSKALAQERDSEIKMEVEKRLKTLNKKIMVAREIVIKPKMKLRRHEEKNYTRNQLYS